MATITNQEVRLVVDLSLTVSTKHSTEELECLLRRGIRSAFPNNHKFVNSAKFAEEAEIYGPQPGIKWIEMDYGPPKSDEIPVLGDFGIRRNRYPRLGRGKHINWEVKAIRGLLVIKCRYSAIHGEVDARHVLTSPYVKDWAKGAVITSIKPTRYAKPVTETTL